MIALACDHGALELKEAIKAHLTERGLAYKDFGTNTKDSCDYPDFGAAAARPPGNVSAASSAAPRASAFPSPPIR